ATPASWLSFIIASPTARRSASPRFFSSAPTIASSAAKSCTAPSPVERWSAALSSGSGQRLGDLLDGGVVDVAVQRQGEEKIEEAVGAGIGRIARGRVVAVVGADDAHPVERALLRDVERRAHHD